METEIAAIKQELDELKLTTARIVLALQDVTEIIRHGMAKSLVSSANDVVKAHDEKLARIREEKEARELALECARHEKVLAKRHAIMYPLIERIAQNDPTLTEAQIVVTPDTDMYMALAKAMATNTHVRYLAIAHPYGPRNACLDPIVYLLEHNKTLWHLRLIDDQIESVSSVKIFAEGLKKNNTIREVLMYGWMCDVGLKHILDALETCTSLVSIHAIYMQYDSRDSKVKQQVQEKLSTRMRALEREGAKLYTKHYWQ